MKYRKPYRIKRKKSILKNRFFWLGILILIFWGTIIYFLFFSKFFQIKEIRISGNLRVSDEEIKNKIGENLESKIFFLPTKSIFLLDSKKIKEEILKQFPQIFDLKINRQFPQTLNINLIERKEVAIFCFEKECFLLDGEGIIFQKSELGESLVKISEGQIEKIPELGERVIEKDYLDDILKIQKYVQEELKIEIEGFTVFERRLDLKTKEGWEIYFDPREDINWQLTKLSAVLKEKIPSERRKDLEYIELRFGDLATFRYR